MPLQSAAIPYRYGDGGQVEILLVTSRKKGRWVLPKGNVRHGMVPHSSAAKEAFEEGGVLGRADATSIASYVRKEKSSEGRAGHRIEVYPMAVATEVPVWPEMHERQRRWVSVSAAMTAVCDKRIRRALKAFDDAYNSSKPGNGRVIHELELTARL